MEDNAADLNLTDDEKSNGGGNTSDDDAENSANHRNNDEKKLDPSRIESFLLDESDDELTEHHDGADGSLAQIVKIKKEARKSV